MTEIKLNEWRWGVVPKLDPEAVVFPGGHKQECIQEDTRPVRYRTLVETCSEHESRWYAVLSLGPPAMPEPELRLPEGWVPSSCYQEDNGEWYMSVNSVSRPDGGYVRIGCRYPTRRECVEEINRILGGFK